MKKKNVHADYARWIFVLPALLVVGALLIYPIFSSLYYSMTTKHLIRLTYDFVGLENYKEVLSDPDFYKAFFTSVLWTAGSLLGQLVIGFTAALAINRVKKGKGIYRIQIDGASKLQQFWFITVPHIKVVVGLLVVLRTIWVFNNFDIIYLLTGGRPANATTTVPIYAYNMGWSSKLLGRSSAVTMLLLAFLLLVCAVYFTIIGKWEKEDK